MDDKGQEVYSSSTLLSSEPELKDMLITDEAKFRSTSTRSTEGAQAFWVNYNGQALPHMELEPDQEKVTVTSDSPSITTDLALTNPSLYHTSVPIFSRKYIQMNIKGFTTYLEPPSHLNEQLLEALHEDLQFIRTNFPSPVLQVLDDKIGPRAANPKGAVLYINQNIDIYDPIESQTPSPLYIVQKGRGMCFHPDADWLVKHGNASEKENTVEIYNLTHYLDWRKHQPQMLLHEFSHMFHWRISFKFPLISDTFHSSVHLQKLYDSVPYLSEKSTRKAYAATNCMEYFASLSVAYFGKNDYFPFTKDELQLFDPLGFEMCRFLYSCSVEGLVGFLETADKEHKDK